MGYKIVLENGQKINAGDDVAPCNLFGTMLWEHVETFLDDYNVSGASSSNTNYKGYMETMLSYNSDARNTHLTAQLFALDTPQEYDECTGDGDNNGYIERKKFSNDSKIFQTIGPITCDFVRASNHLRPGRKLGFKFYRARDSVVLHTGANKRFKLQIVDLKLYYNRIRLADQIPLPRDERYLITYTVLKRFHLPRGTQTFADMIITGGKLPKHIVLAQVRTAAMEGNYRLNPVNFQHFNINHVTLQVNGRQNPSDALMPKFDEDPPQVMREYLSLFMNTGMYRTDKGNCISLKQFSGGMTFFTWDLTPDLCNGMHLHAAQEGTVGLDLKWGAGLIDPVTILVHLSFDVAMTDIQNGAKNEFL